MNGTLMNDMFYVDGCILLPTSPCAGEKLVNICNDFSCNCELTYNAKKTICMVAKPKCLKSLHIPSVMLGSTVLDITDTKKYLGCMMADDITDDADIKTGEKCLC